MRPAADPGVAGSLRWEWDRDAGAFAEGSEPVELVALDKATPLIVYCRSGTRAVGAAKALAAKGFVKVVNGTNTDFVVAAGCGTRQGYGCADGS